MFLFDFLVRMDINRVYVTEIDSICIYDMQWLWDFPVSLEYWRTTWRATISLFTFLYLTAHKKRRTCTFKIVSGKRAKWHERLPMRKTPKSNDKGWIIRKASKKKLKHCIEILYIFIQPLLNPLIGLWRVFDVDFNRWGNSRSRSNV